MSLNHRKVLFLRQLYIPAIWLYLVWISYSVFCFRGVCSYANFSFWATQSWSTWNSNRYYFCIPNVSWGLDTSKIFCDLTLSSLLLKAQLKNVPFTILNASAGTVIQMAYAWEHVGITFFIKRMSGNFLLSMKGTLSIACAFLANILLASYLISGTQVLFVSHTPVSRIQCRLVSRLMVLGEVFLSSLLLITMPWYCRVHNWR